MTKSLLIVISISLLMTGTLFSQHSHTNLGVKGGLNLYNVSTSASSADFDVKAGVHIGLLVHMHLSDIFAIQPEVSYSLQGHRHGDNSLSLGYVNIPILAQFMFAEGFRIQAGPQLGVLLNANADINGSDQKVTDNYNTLEAGITVGASYIHVPTGFGVDLRYNHGLTDITKTNLFKNTNRGVQLGVFYLFNYSL